MLCIIEAMKLMNEIDSEYDGEIVKCYVENGQPVQYGERLFAIRGEVAMFKKILIANRGEIALRVICACRELGIKTVAVYSEADENSLHVRFADEDVCIGPPRERRQLPERPRHHQRRGDHRRRRDPPGYGFLSESAYLAEVCEACHIKFIGPIPQVIRLMGDKARARRVMKKAGVPILPGSDGPVDSEEKATQDRARRSAIRSSSRPRPAAAAAACASSAPADELGNARSRPRSARRRRPSASATSTSRSTSSPPRHIEFQVLGDQHGSVVHLGERECSIQRRHQKLIEESPSVALTDKMRRRMGGIVVDAAKRRAVHQRRHLRVPDGSGRAVLLHGSEHAAAGRAPGHRDGDRRRHRQGADPHRGGRAAVGSSRARSRSPAMRSSAASTPRIPDTFVPSPGVIHVFSVPGGPGVRVETCAHSECTISPYYDSLIAKIIVHGRDRQEAIARMRRTLEMTVIEGIKTTIPAAPAHPRRARISSPASLSTVVHGALPRTTDATSAELNGSPRPSDSCSLPRLTPIVRCRTSTACAGWTVPDSARACLDGGARLLQVRAKRVPSGALLALVRRDRGRRRSFGAIVIVNDRADVARMAGAAGVHVGQDDLTPAAVRADLGPTAIVGLSTHTPSR